ncbi:MAG: hypothetical protein P4M00_24165 [Azospirillaceae bacterium]|nr:hypothetical protein [Azospirillaceae bacterium]
MDDEIDNLTRVHLRRMDGKIDQMMDAPRDHGRRLTALEIAEGNLAATERRHYANTAARTDRTDDRLDRIERRLDLIKPPRAAADEKYRPGADLTLRP